MKLFIDGKQADIDQNSDFSISLTIASIQTPEWSRTGYSKSITIPMTLHNMSIMGNCEEINGRDKFNKELHHAKIEHEGFTIMEGVMMLNGVVKSSTGGGYYNFAILGYGKAWAQDAIKKSFSSLFPTYATTLTGETIMKSWSGNTPVRFFPVLRDRYEKTNSSVGLAPAERVLSYEDYHPFIHIKSIVAEIFKDAGYSVASKFMDTPYFNSLYMSGNYHSKDVSVIKERMNFKASRFDEVTATADYDGRVYANPYTNFNSIGNIVETADPKESKNGVTIEDVFTNNDCFGRDDKRVAFTPLHEVTLGFEYKLRYVTDYRIIGPTELKGFNTVYLGNNDRRTFKISNNFKDRRKEFRAGKSFRCVIFNHISGVKYELVADRVINPDADINNLRPTDYVTESIAIFSASSTLVHTVIEGRYTNLRVKHGVNTGFMSDYKGEWALYDGYINESGKTEVEVTLISKAEKVTPSAPKYFDNIHFAGAEPEMSLTLKSATVKPIFKLCPTQGSKLTFGDVGAHNINRLTVINALKHMFNLYFYTDDLEKRVYIEPRRDFYTNNTMVDWSDKIDFSRNYTIEEIGTGMAKSISFRYQKGDGAVARLNIDFGGDFGSWLANIENAYSKNEVKVLENPLFTPSVNIQDTLQSATSASLVMAGDRDRSHDDFNFSPKIVYYKGVTELPIGERWGWPSYQDRYPQICFSGDGNTLCFDSDDTTSGLKRFWQDTIELYRESKRLTVWINLRPHDIESLLVPNKLGKDFRALYKLRLEGEYSLWRLEEICDYNPYAVSVKCVFIKEV